MATIVVVGHAMLLTLLYVSLGEVVQRSHADLFLQKVRIYSRLVANQLEASGVLESPKLTDDLLDTVIVDGNGVLAEVVGDGIYRRSALGQPGLKYPKEDDVVFSQNSDNIFFIKVPLPRAGRNLYLRLGFDELLTVNTIEGAKRRMFWTLSAYLGISAIAALLLGYAMMRPVRRLQGAARNIADGAYTQGLRVRTRILELEALAFDLDRMRAALVGANDQLRTEIMEKDALEQRRAGLERQLQHRERINTVGTLAGGIAHEFNNVLVPIILLSELTLKSLPDEGQIRSDLQTVLAAALRARELVKQILAFSRDISGLEMKALDLRPLVVEASQLLRPLISPTCQLRLELAEHCALINADQSLVIQLIVNLCRNAYQSLPGSTGQITVSVRDVTVTAGAADAADRRAHGRFVELAVRDNGSGMDQATMARIFEPFFTTRAVGQGTGLGLSVAHGIAERLSARISVESTVGVGSLFRVDFPALAPKPEAT